jgi:pSer/pThr/pTyr-binding forkhead associated (FHA) protein
MEVAIMKSILTLTVKDGTHCGTTYRLEEQRTFTMGRARDCDLPLPSEREFQTVSRRHCLLCITPSSVWVQDLGSRNGTFLNGELLGNPEFFALPDEPLIQELKDGDELKLGGVIFRASIGALNTQIRAREEKIMTVKGLCACE